MQKAIRFLPLIFTFAGASFAASNFEVFPAEVNLKFLRDRQSLVCRWTEPNGVQRNVTVQSKMVLADPAKARVENGIVYPVADGQTKLKVEYNGQSVEIPVKVEEAKTEQAISFRLDVMPIFMRNTCNSGGCHGSSRGKDGFRLSLFGYDPAGDYYRLTREMIGRRINLATPDASMLVTKCNGDAPHTGGKFFTKDSENNQALLRWIEAGAKDDAEGLAEATSIEILPKQLLLEAPDQKFKITVRAHYSDGTDRDVTNLALFLSSNDGSAKIDKEGVITTGQRGEAFVMARFHTYTVGTQVIVIPKNLQYTKPKSEEWNYVDQMVNAKLDKLRIFPSPLCDDETFLRRANIDITGTLPTSDEVKAFIADKDAQKRAKKVDQLLTKKEFVDIWAMKWSELLQIRSTNNNVATGYKSVLTYYTWIREQLEKNVPVNEMARQLISATGSNLDNPATNYYELEVDPLKLAENTAQAFFGTRIQCAQCHNHPFDRWTMADYRGFVSFFSQIGRKPGEDPRERIVFNSGGGEARHPVDNRVIPAKFLGEEQPDCTNKDRRQVLADWVASPKNPFFPRHIANLVWAQYMGRGIVEPVDDSRISNPPSNPELLDALTKKLVEYNFDLRHLVRDICTSAAYQRTTRVNESNALDDRNFAKATIRRMRSEVMLDCITQVTETKDKYRGLPLGARSVELADGKTTSYFLTTFGRSDREEICSREKVGPTLSQALHMLNGDTVEGKIVAGGVVQKLMKANMTPREVAAELYLRCFGRNPTEQELVKLEEHWGVTEEQPKVYTDIFWALMNAKEFMFNH